MTTKQIDNFDPAYRDRIRDAVWNAILEASRDPTTNMAALRNCEIYDALLQLQAIILASSKQAGSAAEMRVIGAQFGRRLRRLVAEFKKTYDRDGTPFAVLHTDEQTAIALWCNGIAPWYATVLSVRPALAWRYSGSAPNTLPVFGSTKCSRVQIVQVIGS